MPNVIEAVRMNKAILKLSSSIGTPDWYQGIKAVHGDKPSIIVLVNRMIPAALINYTIPRDIDTIPVRVVYQGMKERFYGKDGSSTRPAWMLND